MLKELIIKVVSGVDLTTQECIDAVSCIIEGQSTDAQVGSLLTALSIKGETAAEITGFVKVMRDKATFVDPGDGVVVDVCGTGGDGKCTFNISTAVGFVLAGAGVKVAKHGNRASSSKCGSADVLKTLGVNIDADVKIMRKCIDGARIGFLFAPGLHKSMKNVALIRKEMGIRTVFNILGPISNPSRVKNQVLGVYSPDLTEIIATVLKNLDSKHAIVVHGMDGMDEVSIAAKTKVSELKNDEITNYFISPEDFNIPMGDVSDLIVHTPEESAESIKAVLNGKPGTKRNIVLLNAAAGLVCADVAKDMNEGIKLAEQSIDSNNAFKALNNLINISNS